MIRAIVFDCFGVLAADGWLPFKAHQFAGDIEKQKQATQLNRQADAGLISHDQFITEVAQLASISREAVTTAIDDDAPNKTLFAYISDLKQQYKIGLLSNAAADWLSELFTPQELALFDATALSYDIGFSKPQTGAYELIAKRLQVLPEECVMIDDQQRHCDGAIDAGMKAIVYTDFEDCKRQLERLLSSSEN